MHKFSTTRQLVVGSGSPPDEPWSIDAMGLELRPTPVTTIEEEITNSNDVTRVRKVVKREGVV
jgi:hypothetical protein